MGEAPAGCPRVFVARRHGVGIAYSDLAVSSVRGQRNGCEPPLRPAPVPPEQNRCLLIPLILLDNFARHSGLNYCVKLWVFLSNL